MVLDFVQQRCIYILLFLSVTAFVWWFTFRARGVPSIVKSDPEELDRSRESWLRSCGYKYLGSYRINFGNAIAIIANAYLSPDDVKACEIVRIAGVTVTEFTSRGIPFFILCLNDYNGGEVLGYPPYKAVFHSRAKSIEELSNLHDRLLEELRLHGVTPSPLPSGEGIFEDVVVKGSKRDFEHQVRIGRMRTVGDGSYKPTLVGAIIGIPIVWFHGAMAIFTAFLPRDDKSILKQLRKKLDVFWGYPQSDIDYKY